MIDKKHKNQDRSLMANLTNKKGILEIGTFGTIEIGTDHESTERKDRRSTGVKCIR